MSDVEKKLKWIFSLNVKVNSNQLFTSYTAFKLFKTFSTMSATTAFSYAQIARRSVKDEDKVVQVQDSQGSAWQFAAGTFNNVSVSPVADVTPAHPEPKVAPVTEPSLCIPRVFPNLTKEFVKDIIENYERLGEVERVDMVNKENAKGEKFKRVFVHFKMWNMDDEYVTERRDTALRGEMFEIVYDEPWFWKVGRSHAEKPIFDKDGKKKVLGSGVETGRSSVRAPAAKIDLSCIETPVPSVKKVSFKDPEPVTAAVVQPIVTANPLQLVPRQVLKKPTTSKKVPPPPPAVEKKEQNMSEYQSQIDELKAMVAAQTEMMKNLQSLIIKQNYQSDVEINGRLDCRFSTNDDDKSGEEMNWADMLDSDDEE